MFQFRGRGVHVSELNTELQPHDTEAERSKDFTVGPLERRYQLKSSSLSGRLVRFNAAAPGSFWNIVCPVLFVLGGAEENWRFFLVEFEEFDAAPLFGESRMQISVQKWIDLFLKYEIQEANLAQSLLAGRRVV